MKTDFSHDAGRSERAKPGSRLGFAAAALMMAIIAAVVLFNSNFAVEAVRDEIARRTPLSLSSAGGAHFRFLPDFALVIENPVLTSQSDPTHPVLQADQAIIALPWTTLFSRRLTLRDALLDKLVINVPAPASGKGAKQTSLAIPETAPPKNTDTAPDLIIRSSDGSIMFLDENEAPKFQFRQADLRLTLTDAGQAELKGSAEAAGQFVRIEAHAADVQRLQADGTPLDLTLTTPDLEGGFSGRLSLRGGFGLAGTFNLKAAAGGQWTRWFSLPHDMAQTIPTIEAQGPLDSSGALFKSKPLKLMVNGSGVNGPVTLDLGGAVPALTAQLSADALNIQPVLRSDSPASDGMAQQDFLEKTLAIGGLRHLNLDLALSLSKVVARETSFGPLTATVKIADGKLEARLTQTSLFGGMVDAVATVDAAPSPPAASLHFVSDNLDAGAVLQAFFGLNVLRGRGGLSADLTAQGTSVEEMIGTLGGSAKIAMAEGRLIGVDVPQSITAAADRLIEGWQGTAESVSELKSLVGSFMLRDGIASTTDFRAEIASVPVTVTGDADFLRRALDLHVAPDKAVNPTPLAIHIQGPWGRPKLNAVVPTAAETRAPDSNASNLPEKTDKKAPKP